MTDKLLESYMVAAFEYIDNKDNNIVDKDGTVSRSLKSVAASFGPDLNEIGLISTLVAYESKKKDYATMLKIVWDLYKNVKPYEGDEDDAKTFAIGKAGDYAISKSFKRHMMCAGIAVKLTLRSYAERQENNGERQEKEQE